jgi:hypothetical protein
LFGLLLLQKGILKKRKIQMQTNTTTNGFVRFFSENCEEKQKQNIVPKNEIKLSSGRDKNSTVMTVDSKRYYINTPLDQVAAEAGISEDNCNTLSSVAKTFDAMA